MTTLAVKQSKVVPFKVIEGKLNSDHNVNKVSNTYSNKKEGESSEVYAFRTKEEIKAMIDVFNKNIAEASDKDKEKIATRNKLLFIIGIYVGLRASDLRMLKWSFFFDNNMNFIDGKRKIKPKKTRKSDKLVPIFVNSTIKKAISNYIEQYPVENIDTYIFTSRKSTGRKRSGDDDIKDSAGNTPIAESSIYRIIKDAAKEAGIKQNIGSHSLRKTFGYWVWHNAIDKEQALVKLQIIFNHSDTRVTAKYIGITDDEIADTYNSIELGLEFI